MTFISCMLGFMSVGLFSVGSDQKKVHLKALGLDFQFQEAVTSLCAFVLDLLSIWQVARHVVCIKKAWMPTITIEKRTNKLHLKHSGSKTETYDMLYLKDLTRFSKSECRLLAALYLFGIVPWATISQVVGPMTWYLRGRPLHIYGLVTGAFAWARVFFGEEIMVKMYLAMVQLYTPDESVRGEWAKYLFTGNNFLVAGYHFAFGGTFFVVFWIAMHGFDPTDSGYIYMMYYALAFVFGWVQGALQHAPVKPYYFLTEISGDGILIHFHKYEDWRSSKKFKWCSTIRSSDHWLMVFVDDHVTMTELLRGEAGDDD
jgi:hypothetical protein